MWVGTAEGLSRFTSERFTNFTTATGAPSESMPRAGLGRALWVGTPRGLSLYKGGRFTNYTTSDGLPERPRHLSARGARRRALGRHGRGVGTDSAKARFELVAEGGADDPLARAIVLSVFEDAEGRLWVGTESGGLHQLRDRKFTTYSTREGLVERCREGDL